MSQSLQCFKAYDVRGRVPDQLNPEIAFRIGQAFAQVIAPKRVVVGHDIRLSSESIKAGLVDGLTTAGVDVLDIGLCGTEEMYFATSHLTADGGIVVTASHNPEDYNGMKFVRAGSRPISGDSGLRDIQALAETGDLLSAAQRGAITTVSTRDDYVQHLLGYVDVDALRPMTIVCNAGHGGAGLVIDALAPHLPQIRWVKLCHEPDGTFPAGVPNPLLVENRAETAEAVIAEQADLGIAWDGDFDRCFFFDHQGQFIEGYYIVGLLASIFLARDSGGKIVHDPRLYWNTEEQVALGGGETVVSKTGHAFIKETMRAVDAVYGGEMSAHHYFREFFYCDSGMIPWLLIVSLLSRERQPLAALVADRTNAYPCSGEINCVVADPAALFAAVEERFRPIAKTIDHLDGLDIECDDWRFSLRSSNTERVVRLNVETRRDTGLMRDKTADLIALIEAYAE